jgi:orotidine-5'-phosphate decarboxylase
MGDEARRRMSAVSAALQKLEARMDASDSLLCVGLDPEPSRLPERFRSERFPLFTFCREIVDTTARFACAFKPNTAFFEATGAQGWEELQMLFQHLREAHPEVFTICDAKRGDIGNTNVGYMQAIFDRLGADAVTLHPYLGGEAMAPFLEREDRASILLCRTSNPGAAELQDLVIDGKPLWERVAERVHAEWNTRGNCMLVVGATWPDEMRRLRQMAPDMPFLVPGIGAQGGDLAAVIAAGLRADGKGLCISSSRAILYAESPAKAAESTRDAIRAEKERAHAA